MHDTGAGIPEPSLIKKAKSVGACGWLVKPFKRERLLSLARGLP